MRIANLHNPQKPRKLIVLTLAVLCGMVSMAPAWQAAPSIPRDAHTARTFSNPIVQQDTADPWVIQKDGFYYYLFTEGGQISIWKSRSLTALETAQKVTVWRPEATATFRHNVWAPELHWLQGKWYIYFTMDDGKDENHRMFVLESTSTDALGNYVLKGQLEPQGEGENRWAIDGTILQRPDGLYMIWSGWVTESGGLQNLYIARMKNPWTLEGPRSLIATPMYNWEWRNNEAPQVLQRNGRLFIVYSGNAAWTPRYALGLLEYMGGNVMDLRSWKKWPQPVFSSHREGEQGIFGPGHNAFTRSPDGREDWMLFHARLRDGDGWPGRKTFAQRFTWNADGTPNFGRPQLPGALLPRPSGEK